MRLILLLLFFISGGCGLGYEILWTRYLELILGNTTFSVASILSSFMLGFAMGSYYAGKKCNNLGFKAFYFYILCELFIGVFAVCSPYVFQYINFPLRFFYKEFNNNFYVFSIIKFVLITMVLIIPTSLMGATFPLMVETMGVFTSKIGRWSSMLYASNLLGAGAFIAFSLLLFLPKLTLDGTILFFAFLNFCIFVIGLILSQSLRFKVFNLRSKVQSLAYNKVNVRTENFHFQPKEKSMMILYLISGFCSFSLEIVWTRYYVLLAGGSIYSFGMILFGWIIGLGIGSFLSSFFLDKKRGYYLSLGILLFILAIFAFAEFKFITTIIYPQKFDFEFGMGFILLFSLFILVIIGLFIIIVFFEEIKDYYFSFAILQLIVAIFTLMEYVWITLTPYFYMIFYPSQENLFFKDRFTTLWDIVSKYFSSNFEYETVLKILLIFKGILLPTICLGAMLPMLLRGFVLSGISPTKSASLLYIFNCMGAVIGSWVTSFFLIPVFGLKHTNNILAFIFILLFFVSLEFLSRKTEIMKVILLIVALIFVGGAIYYQTQTNNDALLSGVYLYGTYFKDVEQFTDALKYKKRLFLYEGLTSIVDVKNTENEPFNITLSVNGKVDASSFNDLETQVLSGHLGLFYNINAKNVMVIGLGSGITAGAISLYDMVKNIEIVEIEKGVVEAAKKYYRNDNYFVLDNPKVRLVLDDARSYVFLTDKKYDLIVSEPSNPWLTGASSLFTKEFFINVKERLADDGVFVQWFHTYYMHPHLVKSLIKTFASIFPEVVLHSVFREDYQSYSNDIFLVGSNKKLTLDYLHLKKIFSNKKILKDLLRIGIYNPSQIFTTLYLHKKDIESIAADKNIKFNTDKNMYVEFSASKYLGKQNLSTMTHNEIEKVKTVFIPDIKNYEIKKLVEFDFIKKIVFNIRADDIVRAIPSFIRCHSEGNILCGIGLFYLYLRDSKNDFAHKFLVKKLRRKIPKENFLDLLLYYNNLQDNHRIMKNILLKMNRMLVPESAFLEKTAYYFKGISYLDKFFEFLKRAIKKDKNNLHLYNVITREAKNYNRIQEYIKYYKIMLKVMYGYNLANKIFVKKFWWAK